MADLDFEITGRVGLKALGTLTWSAEGLTTTAISGPYGNGALPTGMYEAPRSKLLDKNGQTPYTDKKGKGWMQAFKEPNFSKRTGLGIHPDGNVVGTEGCIGIEPTDTKEWYDAFAASKSALAVEVKDGANVLVEKEDEKLTSLPRPLTNIEKSEARRLWPRMDADNTVVSGEATDRYNCLAWTLGITTSWVWPWGTQTATKAQFDDLYRRYNFNPAASGEIAAFGLTLNNMTHGAISGAGHGPRWESKAGAWLRLQHGLGEMEGSPVYGRVQGFYARARFDAATQKIRDQEVLALLSDLSPNEDERAALRVAVAGVPIRVRREFEHAYSAWKNTWSDPTVVTSSSPVLRTENREFRELILLAPAVLPLLIEKLLDPDEFFALLAAERMVLGDLSARFDVDDPRVLTGEQGRALAFAHRWIALNL